MNIKRVEFNSLKVIILITVMECEYYSFIDVHDTIKLSSEKLHSRFFLILNNCNLYMKNYTNHKIIYIDCDFLFEFVYFIAIDSYN